LIVFAGLRGEKEPMGAHFYEFRDDKIVFLETVETAPDFRNVGQNESEQVQLLLQKYSITVYNGGQYKAEFAADGHCAPANTCQIYPELSMG